MRPVRRAAFRSALAGALLFPVATLTYLVAVGYGTREAAEVFRGAAFPGSTAVLLLSLVVAGGVLGVALQRRYRLVAVGVLLFVLLGAWDPLFASPPDGARGIVAFAADALLLSVLSTLGLAVAWARRHPATVRGYVTRRALRVGVLAGVGHLLLAVVLRGPVFGFTWGGRSVVAVALVAWMLAGAFLEGSVPVFLLVRERLVAPVLVVAGCLGWATYDTWQSLQHLERTGAAMAAAITPFTLYLVGWFGVVAVAVAAGLAERAARSRISRR